LVLLAKNNNGEASYNRGYQQGRQDARNNRSSDYRDNRGNSKKWDSDFRRGYEDGYYNGAGNNSSYGRSRNDGTYNRSGNDWIYDRSANGTAFSGPGRMTWRGQVDAYVELTIQGNRVRSIERDGAPTINEQVNFSNSLPRADVRVSVNKLNGRGEVSVIEQPNQSNNYTAIIKIVDDKGGADDYEIEVDWR
jgi:hypothetical protein